MLSRMKYICRWGLMRNTREETLSEHCLETAVIAHALAVLSNKRLGTAYNAERVALLAIYHDAPEIITGDLPTPVKYFSEEIRSAYKEVETVAARRLLFTLPADLREDYQPLLLAQPQEKELWRLVKAADKISALIKCIEEEKAGNTEFKSAKESTLAHIEKLGCPAAQLFVEQFIPGYSLTIDEQSKEKTDEP